VGYRLPKRTAVLEFKGTDYDGAKVRTRLDGISLEEIFYFQRMAGADAKPEQLEEAMRIFGDRVILEWNLEDDDGQPIPYDGASSFLKQPAAFAMTIMSAWTEAAMGGARPLPQPSANGAQSEPAFALTEV